MKIACMSDVHGLFKGLSWPRTDVLVLAGDICNNHSRLWAADVTLQGIWLEQAFVPMCKKLLELHMYKDIVITPGNHDRVFQTETEMCRNAFGEIENVHLLIDEGAVIQDKRFWGSPWTPWFYGKHWAYNLPDPEVNHARARAHARNVWELIPKETDVLITHGPPFTIMDLCPDGKEAGCPHLAEAVFKRIRPEVHIFGHIHDGRGVLEKDGIRFVNACICTEEYKATNAIQVVEI